MKPAIDIIRLHDKRDKNMVTEKTITTHSNDPIGTPNVLVPTCFFYTCCVLSFIPNGSTVKLAGFKFLGRIYEKYAL